MIKDTLEFVDICVHDPDLCRHFGHLCDTLTCWELNLMAQSHERIFRRIFRRFGSFPRKTYSNRILSDVNILITYEELPERTFYLYNTCT